MWKEIHPRPQEKENLKFSSIIFSDVNYFVVVFSFFSYQPRGWFGLNVDMSRETWF